MEDDRHGSRHFDVPAGPDLRQHRPGGRDQPRHAQDPVGAAGGHAGAAVTVGGNRYPLPDPFFVLATQNPIEMEGTYPLPEAQLDRFLLKLKVEYPSAADLAEIIERTTKPHRDPAQRWPRAPRWKP